MRNRNILIQSLDDFMSPKVIFISIITFLITTAIILFSTILMFENIGEVKDIFPEVARWIDTLMNNLEEYSVLAFLLEHKIIMTVFHYLMYFGLGILAYYIFFGL